MHLAQAILRGEERAGARLMRDLDDRIPGATEVLKELYPSTGRARIIGLTGAPGCGKSTLVDALISLYRRQDRRVGVVAVDPSSPFSGGALLGDRIRMQRHAVDQGVFIRSLASRGQLGGLSRSSDEIISVMDAMGYDPVLVETVGVGQAEVDIVGAAHLSVVVVSPGLGDSIQAMKAGILEIADVLCLNKADLEAADRAARDLQQMVALRGPEWPRPAIVRTVANRALGVAELLEELERRLDRRDEEAWRQRLLARARRQLQDLVRELATRLALEAIGSDLEALAAAVARRELDPYSAVEGLLAEP